MLPLPRLTPLAPKGIGEPFDHPDWLFELKHDGFRALAYLERGKRVELVSRKGNVYKRFGGLAAGIAEALPVQNAILDGEIVCLDERGHSHFHELFSNRGAPALYTFDIVWLNGSDLRETPLIKRKSILQGLIPMGGESVIVADHVVGRGVELFRAACQRDCEGIVGKWAQSPYRLLDGRSPWVKVLNPEYTRTAGRQDLFQRRARR